jgi:hypothetical protein
MTDELEKYPDLGAAPVALKKALGLLTGGFGEALVDMVILPTLERRKREWFEGLAKRLRDLEARVDGLEADSDKVTTSVLTATALAMRTHQREKLEALQNAVVNSVLGTEAESEVESLFMSFVDSFTPLHLSILRAYDEGGDSLSNLRTAYSTKAYLSNAVLQDLSSRGLLLSPVAFRQQIASPTNKQPHLTLQWPVTELGRRFIRFISHPESE